MPHSLCPVFDMKEMPFVNLKFGLLIAAVLIGFSALYLPNRIPGSVALSRSEEWRNALNSASSIQVHEGLPHPSFENGLLEGELRRSDVFHIDEFPFYTTSYELKGTKKGEAIKILSSQSSYRIFGGEKPCGGFHPDFAITWMVGDLKVYELLCFGCSEAMILAGRKKYRYDVKDGAKYELVYLLWGIATNRPPSALLEDLAISAGVERDRMNQPAMPRD
jgi:hypothetical protein